MLIKLTNTINSIVRRGLSVIRNGLKMWLPFEKSEILGEELVVNGDFATDSSGWTEYNINTTFNPLLFTNSASNGKIYQTFTTTIGATYEVSINKLSGNWTVYASTTNSTGGSLGLLYLAGTESGSFIFTATTTTTYILNYLIGGVGTEGSISNISIKEVTQIAPDKSGVDNEILGEEEVQDGTFSNDFDYWSAGSDWGVVDNIATLSLSDSATNSTLTSDGTLTTSKTYLLTYTISNWSQGELALVDGNISLPSTNGNKAVYFTSQDSFSIKRKGGATALSISNISVKEVTQDYAEPNSAKLFTGKALSFDGVNDYVDFGSDVNSDGTVWTTAIWIGDYTAGSYDWIYGDTTQQSIGLSYGSVQNTVFYRDLYGTFVEFSCDAFKSDFTNAKRLVFTSDGTDISLYIDGEFIDSITPTSTVLKLSRLMAGYDTTSYMVAATVSDFQLYNTAWTQADVTFDYNNPQHLVTDNSELRYGSELVDNGDFATDSYWTYDAAQWSISDGKATASGVTGLMQNANNLTLGKTYKVTVEITDYTSGTVKVFSGAGGDDVPDLSSINTHTFTFTAGLGALYVKSTTFIGSISNISVKEVTSPTLNNLKGYWHLSEGDGDYAYNSAVALGSEEVDNGDFATDGNWVKGAGWTISGGSANGSSTTGDLYQEDAVESGKYYQVTYTISNYVSGSVRVELPSNAAAGIERSANGTYTETLLSAGTIVMFDARTSFTGSIDNVSVKEVSVGEISGATWSLKQATIPQLGLMDWSKPTIGSDVVTLIADPNNPSEDILGNSVRLREHSLNLDGSGYAEVPDADSLDITSTITLECWVKWNTEDGKGLLAKWGGSNSLRSYIIEKTTNGLKFKIRVDGLGTYIAESGSITGTDWKHITCVYNGSNQTIYVDSSVSGTPESNTGAINSSNTNVEIGRAEGSNYYSELIDDVRIYNRALSSDEVEQNHKAGLNKHKTGSSFSDDFSSDYGF